MNRCFVRDIRLYADGLASGLVDFCDEGLVVGRRTGEKSDRIFLSEAPGDRGTGLNGRDVSTMHVDEHWEWCAERKAHAWANTGNDGDGFGHLLG